jgi:hypothetical protein
MQYPTFAGWLRGHQSRPVRVPEATRLLQLVAAAGPAGVSRGQLGGALHLPREVLDQLLDALVQAGQLRRAAEGGLDVYQGSA